MSYPALSHAQHGNGLMLIPLDQLILLGWIAVIGASLNVIGDWLLLAFPRSGRDMKMTLIAKKPAWSVRLGAYLGMLAIPMWLFVLFPVAYLLRDAPVLWAATALIALTFSICFSLVYHVSYVFYDIAYRHFTDSIDAVTTEKECMQLIMKPVGVTMGIAILIAGLLANAPLLWLVANPLLLAVLLPFASRYVPAPLGGYALTGAGSFAFGIFALVTMLSIN